MLLRVSHQDKVLATLARMRLVGPRANGPWDELLDFVDRTAAVLGLSGWSLGLVEGEQVRTYSRGFPPDVCAKFATFPLDEHLPGPVTFETGRAQYFVSREHTYRDYPGAAAVDLGSSHDAAAVLPLGCRGRRVGYLALHYPEARTFDPAERGTLARLADTIGYWVGAVAVPPRPTVQGS
jgi:GAF domain-containing protein